MPLSIMQLRFYRALRALGLKPAYAFRAVYGWDRTHNVGAR